MKHWRFFKILLVICVTSTYVLAKNDVKIVFLQISCSFLSNKIKTLNCSTDFVKKRSTFSMHWTQNDDLQMLLARTQVSVLQLDQRKLKLYDVQFDICQILNRVPRRNLVQIITNRLKEASYNFPTKCPLRKDVVYGYKNVYMGADLVPTYLPDFNFTVTLDTFVGKEQMVAIKIKGVTCKTQDTCESYL